MFYLNFDVPPLLNGLGVTNFKANSNPPRDFEVDDNLETLMS